MDGVGNNSTQNKRGAETITNQVEMGSKGDMTQMYIERQAQKSLQPKRRVEREILNCNSPVPSSRHWAQLYLHSMRFLEPFRKSPFDLI